MPDTKKYDEDQDFDPAKYPGGAPIDVSRAIVHNPDGSFSTERSITITSGGKEIVIPTIVGGKERSEDEAVELWKNGKNKAVGTFDDPQEAEYYAQQRSMAIARLRAKEAGVDQRDAPGPETVPLINAYGQLEHVPASKLAEAKEQGYRPESDEEFEKRYSEKEYGGVGNELLAGGLGAARSLSFGLSDVGLTKFGVAPSKLLHGLKEENPASSLTGEVAGAVVPLLVGDAGGLVGGAAEGAGAAVEGVSVLGHAAEHGVSHLLAGLGEEGMKGLARDVAAKMAGGAVEGAFYGAGHEISESALGDTELTAERLLAGAGTGALLGGAVQGLIGLTGGGIGMMKKAVEEKLGGTLGDQAQKLADDFAETSRLRAAFGQSKKAMRKVFDEERPYFRKQVGDELKSVFEERASSPTTLPDVADVLEKRRDLVSGERAATLARLDELAGKPSIKVADVAAKIEGDLTKDLEPVSHGHVIDKIKDYAARLREHYGEEITFDQATKLRQGAQELGKFDAAKPAEITKTWRDISRLWNDAIDEQAAPLLKGAGLDEAAYKLLRQREAGLIKMTELSKDGVLRNLANRRVSLTDNMAGLGLGGGLLAGGHFVAGPLGAVVGAAANKLGRMYGPAGIANLAEKTAQMLAVARASAKIDTSLSEEVVAFIEKAKLAGARAATGAEHAGAHTAEKLAHERIGARQALARVEVPTASKILESTRFLPEWHQSAAESDPGEKDKTLAAFRQRAAELTTFVSSPEAIIDRASELTRGLTTHMPEMATHAAGKIMQAAQFLYDKLPKAPEASNPVIKNAWQPARAEVERFARYVRAANDPKTVLADLRAGRLSKEGVEVLRELYPKLYGSLAAKMVSKLSEQPAHLDHQSKLQLSRFLGYPIEGALRPDRTRLLQQQWAGQPHQGQGGGGMRLTGIEKIHTDKSVMTRSQQLAQGPQ